MNEQKETYSKKYIKIITEKEKYSMYVDSFTFSYLDGKTEDEQKRDLFYY